MKMSKKELVDYLAKLATVDSIPTEKLFDITPDEFTQIYTKTKRKIKEKLSQMMTL